MGKTTNLNWWMSDFWAINSMAAGCLADSLIMVPCPPNLSACNWWCIIKLLLDVGRTRTDFHQAAFKRNPRVHHFEPTYIHIFSRSNMSWLMIQTPISFIISPSWSFWLPRFVPIFLGWNGLQPGVPGTPEPMPWKVPTNTLQLWGNWVRGAMLTQLHGV